MKIYILNKNGRPKKTDDLTMWSECTGSSDKRGGLDSIKIPDREPVKISTVFLGLDHSWGGGRPILYETMVFNHPTDDDNLMVRYHTKKEALAGHKKMVKKLKKEFSKLIKPNG